MKKLLQEFKEEKKKIFFSLRNKQIYNGTILEISEEENGIYFITILDKFEKKVVMVSSEITSAVESRE